MRQPDVFASRVERHDRKIIVHRYIFSISIFLDDTLHIHGRSALIKGTRLHLSAVAFALDRRFHAMDVTILSRENLEIL